MFLGHHAAGLAGKHFAPRVSLGTLLLASTLLDLVWPILLLLGIEHVRIVPGITAVNPLDFYDYPYTHSLATVLAGSIAIAALYYSIHLRGRDSRVVGMLVLSHWLIDLPVHRPDLPLWPGGPKVGLGLWSSLPATLVIEGALFVIGLVMYLRTTSARDRTGHFALWSFVVFTIAVYALSLTSPPPPSPMAIGWGGLAAWLFVPWGYWIDRHREVRA